MTPPRSPNSPLDTDSQDAEQRMRRNLGMSGDGPRHGPQQGAGQARARHRFVQDGEVPVVALSGGGADGAAAASSRFADLHAALESERSARSAAVRSLEESRHLVQSLQARLAHAELAAEEAIAAERRARNDAERALTEVVATNTREVAYPGEAPLEDAGIDTAKRKVGRPRKSVPPVAEENEPEPVKWWIPGYNTKTD